MDSCTIVDAIEKNATGGATLTALDTGETLTWGELAERARRTATVLAARGVGPGSRVALEGVTSVHTVAAVEAVWMCGAAVTLWPPGRGESAKALTALATRAPQAEVVHPSPGDLAVLQYTSGSTRAPAGVAVTHGHLLANLEAIGAATGHAAMHPGRILSWLPLYHDMGLIGFLCRPLFCGCDLYLQSPTTFAARPAGWFQAIAEHRINVTGGPNFAFAVMTRLLRAGLRADLSSLRLLLTGAEPIDATMMHEFSELAARSGLDPGAITPAYGLAEATLAVAMRRGLRFETVDGPAGAARQVVMVGPPVPGVRVRIGGVPTGTSRVGEIEVSGPSVVGGGWLRTGDLGYLADGELVVCGRAKDVVFAAGRNIFPQDIEACAGEATGVRPGGVVAFAVPGALGDRLVVAIEMGDADPAAVKSAVAQAVLAEVGLSPADVLIVPRGRMPRTSSGKLRRGEARRRYLEGIWQ